MQSKSFLLIMLLISHYDTVLSHIVTSVGKMPLFKCMKELSDAMLHHYCPMVIEEFAPVAIEEFAKGSPQSISQEINEWYSVIRECCLNPCTIGELTSICT